MLQENIPHPESETAQETTNQESAASQEASAALKEAEAALAAADKAKAADEAKSADEAKPADEAKAQNAHADANSVAPDQAGSTTASPAEADKSKAAPEASDDPYRKRYMYLMAEFDNYKKQSFKERAELIKYASTRVLCDLLDIIDDFDRALHTETSDLNSFRQGVQMTAKNLLSTLEKHGLQCDNTQPGTRFDPSVHEALSRQVSEQVPPGHILHVHKKAYRLHDKLVRPAQVVVAEAQTEAQAEAEAQPDTQPATQPETQVASAADTTAEVKA